MPVNDFLHICSIFLFHRYVANYFLLFHYLLYDVNMYLFLGEAVWTGKILLFS